MKKENEKKEAEYTRTLLNAELRRIETHVGAPKSRNQTHLPSPAGQLLVTCHEMIPSATGPR